ncbi:MAG: hypothetical protein ACM3UZ_11620 [Acidobacteriota bacterium]
MSVRTTCKKNRGAAMLMFVIVALILFTIGIAFLSVSVTDTKTTYYYGKGVKNYYTTNTVYSSPY